MLNIYIDCFMREEVTKPELIKFINIDSDNKDYKSSRNQTNYISDKEKKKNLGTNLEQTSHYQAFQESQKNMPELLENIFDYFESHLPQKRIDNVLTFELLEVVLKLINFQIVDENANLSDDSFSNSLKKESFLVRIIKSILPLLLKISDLQNKSDTTIVKRRLLKSDSKILNNTKINHNQYLTSILKDSNSLNDPVIRSAANLKNYLNSYRQNPFKCLEKKSIEHKIKLRICKIIEYYLDTRQEFLINNTIE